jgi:hypothetical protein
VRSDQGLITLDAPLIFDRLGFFQQQRRTSRRFHALQVMGPMQPLADPELDLLGEFNWLATM